VLDVAPSEISRHPRNHDFNLFQSNQIAANKPISTLSYSFMTSSILALSYFIFANGISSDTRLSHIYF
jgi:hypothetical protein